MRITKPLIISFYVLVIIKSVAMIATLINSIVNQRFNLEPDLYTPLWWEQLVNYIAESLLWSLFIMQWLHLAYTIQVMIGEISDK